jgi:hypothetical protein
LNSTPGWGYLLLLAVKPVEEFVGLAAIARLPKSRCDRARFGVAPETKSKPMQAERSYTIAFYDQTVVILMLIQIAIAIYQLKV